MANNIIGGGGADLCNHIMCAYIELYKNPLL